MEVVLPSSPPMEFDFGFGSQPINYLSAPSSPRRSGPCFLSAPASPTRISEFYRQYEDFSIAMEMSHVSRAGPSCSVSSVPFSWEEKPGTPKKKSNAPATDESFDFDFDFAFDVKVESDMGSAEELFSGGKIRPLKPPPRLRLPQLDDDTNQRTPLIPSPRSPSPSSSPIAKGRKLLMEAFSPRKKQSDPFRVSEKQSKKQSDPFRVSEEQSKKQSAKQQEKPSPASLTSSSSSSAASTSSRRWRFKDFLLFRSASEGRGSDKDPLRKYVKRQEAEAVKNGGSFRSSGGSFRSEAAAAGSASRRRVSAHEMHYAANRAASEDMRKRTFLPYKQGILGRLAFNPAVHALANGFGSLVVKNER